MPKADNREWPKEKVDQLKLMAKDGYLAREIGERLGYSKNSVCGKCLRIGISLKVSRKVSVLNSQRFGRKGKMPEADLPPKEPMGNGCLWPMDDKWCGCDVAEGSPYCEEHVKAAYKGRATWSKSELKKLLGLI
jgi:hypothetical protein